MIIPKLREPPPKPSKRGRPKQSVGRNLLNRLQKYEDGVLALEPVILFTKNPYPNGTYEEQRLNKRSVSVLCQGVILTHVYKPLYVRKQGHNVFTSLRNLFSPLLL